MVCTSYANMSVVSTFTSSKSQVSTEDTDIIGTREHTLRSL